MSENTSEDSGFASMFEQSLKKTAKLVPGQPVETTIVSISNDTIFLELSGKSEGVLDRAELTDKEGKLSVKEGDTIKVYFLGAKNGEMRFTARIKGESANNEMLENAFKSGSPVEGTVEKEIKGGYEVKIGDARAFCPFSQMGGKREENAESPVGKKLTFKIQEYAEKGRRVVVSNRAIVAEEKQKQLESLRETLHEGMTVKGTVVSIQDFGAFVDVSGFKALLPVSELARTRVEDVKSVVSEGQEIEAQIIRIDWKAERMTLSLKALLADPWDGVAARYAKGSKHQGKISRIADFGAFVTLEPGIDGLLHVSELRGDDKFGDALSSVKKGETISVVIKEVDAKNRRISLKQVSAFDEDTAAQSYMKNDVSGDTYNPFAALLKKK